VGIGDVDAASAAATAKELGGGVLGLPLDVTDRAGFTAFLDEVERRLGPLDILVNNAGIMPVGAFDEEDEATVVRILEINLHAVIRGSKEAVRRMKPRGSGHIVNVASVAGKTAFPNLVTYCAAKHGVVGLSEALRVELRGTGIGVSVVMPAIVRTELAAGLRPSRGFKPSTPEEVAEAIVEALRVDRFDVYVPRTIGPTWVGMQVLPRRAREALARALRIDRALLDADHAARAAYEARAAASAPAADAEEEAAEAAAGEQAAA
jgi:NAD(P)-dependent dehydrogenase (short-subunit alcohol dehydrogenase family)